MPLQSGSQHTDIAGRKIQAVRIFQHDPEIATLLRRHLIVSGSFQRLDMRFHFAGGGRQRAHWQLNRDRTELPFSGNRQGEGDFSCLYRVGILFSVKVFICSIQKPQRFP